MTLDGILFDLDGTLANTLPVCIQAFQATVQHFNGRTPTESEIYAHFGPNEEGMLEQLIPGQLDKTLPYFLQTYEQFHYQCTQPFPGVDNLFAALHAQGIRTAIVTGKGAGSAAISMRILGLAQWIEIIESGFASGANKQHSIRLVLNGWGIPPERAAYVGDMPADMLAAREVGVLPIAAAWAETSTLRGHPITQDSRTFYHIHQLTEWIQQL